MTDQHHAGEARRGATAAQLQGDIDGGRTGDKVAGFDPAAAPLGTDDEAAGVPPAAELVAQARAQERCARPVRAPANGATPALAPDAHMPPQGGLMLAAVAGFATAGLLGGLLLFLL